MQETGDLQARVRQWISCLAEVPSCSNHNAHHPGLFALPLFPMQVHGIEYPLFSLASLTEIHFRPKKKRGTRTAMKVGLFL